MCFVSIQRPRCLMKCFHPSAYLRESEALVRKVPGCKTLREITVWMDFCPACFHPSCSWTWECKAYVLFRKLPCEGQEVQLEGRQLADCLTTQQEILCENPCDNSHTLFFFFFLHFNFVQVKAADFVHEVLNRTLWLSNFFAEHALSQTVVLDQQVACQAAN